MLEQAILDEFAMIARRGAENAGASMSKWLHTKTAIESSSVEVVGLDLIAEEGTDSGATTITLAARVDGALPGNVAGQLTYTDATALVACLGGNFPPSGQASTIGEMERSMLQETANILFSSLMNSMAQHLGIKAVPYAPAVRIDIGTAAWDMLLLECAEEADEVVVVTARLACIGSGPKIRLVYLPSPLALIAIRKELKHEHP